MKPQWMFGVDATMLSSSRGSQSSGRNPENDFPRARGRWALTQEPSMSDKDVPRFGWHAGRRGRKAWPEGVVGRKPGRKI